MQTSDACLERTLHDRGASNGDERGYGGRAWPPIMVFGIAIAHCFSKMAYNSAALLLSPGLV